MVLLGLGSNLADRLQNLRACYRKIAALSRIFTCYASPLYYSNAQLPDNAPAHWNLPYLNLVLKCETNYQPLELLSLLQQIECELGREQSTEKWSPRIIDIDILAWDDLLLNLPNLTIPHPRLLERPFALWPLADLAPLWLTPQGLLDDIKSAAQLVESWGSRFNGQAPCQTKQIAHRIDTAALVGILNVTPDSFSDGGLYENADKCIEHAIKLNKDGAEVIDIGAESTAPNAKPLTAEQEWQRLEPILALLSKEKTNFIIQPKISIDTRHYQVAAQAQAYMLDWVNDVTGLIDVNMQEFVAKSGKRAVIMHHLSLPPSAQTVLPRTHNPMDIIYQWSVDKLNDLHKIPIKTEQIILDVGIGFGKAPEQSLLLLREIERLKSLNVQLLVGHSRKSFLHLLTAAPANERDPETAAIALWLAKRIDYIRVHDVALCARLIKTLMALG
jgi:2-amino-4-hydroxy-6-hydroxymethyldihydropteridine diphosphokinase / dihydropteroate synthase